MNATSSPLIKATDLSISIKGLLVLEHVNFEINKSELVYLVGKTGSGKSSLLKTIYAQYKPTSGTMIVNGYNINAIKKAEIPQLRRTMGIVFQDFQLLNDRTLFENLEFVLKATGWKDVKAIKTRIDEVLTSVNLNTKDFKKPFQLSGGEQQRLVIARALLNKPTLIIADEPTGNLDPDTSLEVIDLLKNVVLTGTSVIVSTHDYYVIEKFPSRLLKVESNSLLDVSNIL